ncbi:MAG: hypothetical protein ACYS30_05230 [Planctomycetota bacterium]|jgi:hypothetical protein
MDTSPRSVYVNNRPQKIAFLIDLDEGKTELFDYILKYNRSKWGGSYNPIIVCDGKTINDEQWNFLREYDADIIKSFVPLSDVILYKFEYFLSPYCIEVPYPKLKLDGISLVRIHNDSLDTFPTPRNLRDISHSFIDKEPILILFETKLVQNQTLKKFIEYNFGVYEHYMKLDWYLKQVRTKVFTINSLEDFCSALRKISEIHNKVFPRQICSLPNFFRDVKYNYRETFFKLIVGDSIQDLIQFWNQNIALTKSKRDNISYFWLPSSLANNSVLVEGINFFINRCMMNEQQNRTVEFISYSVPSSELDGISDKLIDGLFCRKIVNNLTEYKSPDFEKEYFSPTFVEKMQFKNFVGTEGSIIVNQPDVPRGAMGPQYWMTDVFLEYRHEGMTTNAPLWLNLPNRNKLTRILFDQISRISSNGIPAVVMAHDKPNLNIRFPGSASLLSFMLSVENTPCFQTDPRSNIAKASLKDVRRSNNGRYLSGFLDMLGGLSSAYYTLQNRYWRKMFDRLSNISSEREDGHLNSIKNKLKKRFDRMNGNINVDSVFLNWLSSYILQVAKIYTVTGRELSYSVFREQAEDELSEFNDSINAGAKFEFKEEDLKNSIHELLKKGVLLKGIRPHCPNCGFRNWYHINETKQLLKCNGCMSEFYLKPEETWFYKLNSLVQAGVAIHGLVPLVLVLGQLEHHEFINSFFYLPSVDIFLDSDKEPFTDIDVVCVCGNKFVIGEVKKSTSLFTSNDFEKMCEVAKILRPNLLIFASLDNKPNDTVNRNIDKIAQNLKDIEVEVKWYKLNSYFFEPSPVR